jgi:hypothetical protein
MALTSCPRDASQAAISPEYLPIPVGSGAKLALQIRIFMLERCKDNFYYTDARHHNK